MRSRLSLVALLTLSLSACGGWGQRRAGAPEPVRYERFVPQGARAKVTMRGGVVIEGTLLSRFTDGAPELVICQAAPCDSLTSPGVRRVPADSVQRLQVWGRRGGYLGLMGLYTGGAAGAFAGGDEDGGWLLLGSLAGAGLGYLIGSQVQGWNVALPCVHACGGWETERVPARAVQAAPAP